MKLPKLKYWYHATDIDTANKIVDSGYLIPQPHKGDQSLGVFFANTMMNAAQWMMMRGITDYVVFKIPRSRFTPNKMLLGQADRMPPELGMVCMRYLDLVKVYANDGQVCQSPSFEIPGVEFITEGTKKLSAKIVDMQAFESYVEQNPRIKELIKQKKAAE